MPAGRPSLFTPELGMQICEMMSEGEIVLSICRRDDMPSRSTLMNWLAAARKDTASTELKEFLDNYTQARELLGDFYIDQGLLDARDNSGDTAVDGEGNIHFIHGNVQRSRAMAEYSFKYAEKIAPRIHGVQRTENRQVDGNGNDVPPAGTQHIEVLLRNGINPERDNGES